MIKSFCPSDKIVAHMDYGYDVIDRGYGSGTSQSDIRYRIDGESGSRIFKLEWYNVGFDEEYWEYKTSNWYANVQLWIYEANQSVEYHFGETYLPDPKLILTNDKGPNIAISRCTSRSPNKSSTESYTLMGSPKQPQLQYFADGGTYVALDSLPSNGMVYTFTPTFISSVEELDKQ